MRKACSSDSSSTRLAGEVAQVADHHPVAFVEGDRRLRAGEEPHARAPRRPAAHFRGQRGGAPPQRNVAPRLGRAASARAAVRSRVRRLRRFPGLGHALEAPAAVDFQIRCSLRSPSSRAARRASGSAVADSRIWPGRASVIRRAGERLGEAFDFQRLGAGLHRGFAVAPGQHFADVQAGARLQRELAAFGRRARAGRACSRARSRGRRSGVRTAAASRRNDRSGGRASVAAVRARGGRARGTARRRACRRGVRPGRSNRTGRSAAACGPAGAGRRGRVRLGRGPNSFMRVSLRSRRPQAGANASSCHSHAVAAQALGAIQRRVGQARTSRPTRCRRRPGRRRR